VPSSGGSAGMAGTLRASWPKLGKLTDDSEDDVLA
jgi:hypothetical protein